MKIKLVVTSPFTKRGVADGEPAKDYSVGQEITDASEMKAVLESHRQSVVRTNAEPEEGDPDHKAPKRVALADGGGASEKT